MEKEIIQFKENLPLMVNVQKIKKYPIHWHENETEVIIPINGSVEVHSNFEHFTVSKGDFIFVNHHCIHNITSSSETVVALLYINLDHFEEQFEHIKYMFFRSSMFSGNQINLDDSDFEDDIRKEYKIRFRNLLISILSDSVNNYSSSESLLKKYEQQLIYALVYEFDWLQFIRKNKDFISSIQLNRYHRIVKYIDAHYDQKITLDDIVSREFITKNYLSHFWKKVSSFSLQERINYERVLKSQFLLNSDMNVATISEKCGFSDVKYYYQSFKKWFKRMPLEHKAWYMDYFNQDMEFTELAFNDVKKLIYQYVNNYFMVQCNYNDYPDISSSIENYLKIRHLYIIEKNLQTDAPKYIVINPFHYNNFHMEDSDVVFNWHNMDLWVNLTIDLGYNLHIKISSENIQEELFCNALENFLDRCIYRYGIKTVKKWYFINNSNDIIFERKDNIVEKIIMEKVNHAKIAYSFEF